MKTALSVAQAMKLPAFAREMLEYRNHPQDRTEAFHEVFGAPVHQKMPDATFSHMDDQRVAFRLSFILSEAFEILEKGFGLNISFAAKAKNETIFKKGALTSDNAQLCEIILAAIQASGYRDLVEVVDGLGDLNVVNNGFAIELGVDMTEIDQEVYASNLTKLDENGNPIVADGSDPKYPAGKILKGPNFIEPQIAFLLGVDRSDEAQAA